MMFKEIQRQLLSQDRIMHIDFIRISLTEKVEVEVPLSLPAIPRVKKEACCKYCPGALHPLPAHGDSRTCGGRLVFPGDGRQHRGRVPLLPPGAELVTAPEEPVVQVLAPSAAEEEAVEEKAEPEEAEEGPGETEEES